MMSPVALLAVGLILINDHVLKGAFGNALTGKLSDVAGLVFFPLLAATLAGAATRLVTRRPVNDRSVLALAVVATALAFVGINTLPAATGAYEMALGALQYPFRALSGHAFALVESTPDVTDLVALPALAVAWWVGAGATVRPSSPCSSSEAPESVSSFAV